MYLFYFLKISQSDCSTLHSTAGVFNYKLIYLK